jgi:hypothetical protein
VNYDPTADGLARVQSESHIPASTWRQWCVSLNMDPSIAIELWDEICHPLMLASGKAPDVALILRLRASRPDIYVMVVTTSFGLPADHWEEARTGRLTC